MVGHPVGVQSMGTLIVGVEKPHTFGVTSIVSKTSSEGLLGYFQFKGNTNRVSVNINVQAFVWTYAFISLG